MGAQAACVIPDELFGCQPACALDIGAFDLSDVERRVEALADVMEDVGAEDAVLAGEGIDDDFGDCRAMGEVEERATMACNAVPAEIGGFVKAGGREADAVLVAGGGGFGEAHAFAPDLHAAIGEVHLVGGCLMERGQCIGHAVTDRVAGDLGGHAVEIRAGGGGGGGGGDSLPLPPAAPAAAAAPPASAVAPVTNAAPPVVTDTPAAVKAD